VGEGIGVNKLISQIASELNKPAASAQVLPAQEIPVSQGGQIPKRGCQEIRLLKNSPGN
jgi:hypothetical protein